MGFTEEDVRIVRRVDTRFPVLAPNHRAWNLTFLFHNSKKAEKTESNDFLRPIREQKFQSKQPP